MHQDPPSLTAALGPNRVPVSRLGFGGAAAGLTNYIDTYDPSETINRETMLAALRYAVAQGVRYFDTAPGYGDGLAETIFGEALQGAPVFVATKVSLGAAGRVRQSLEASLRRDRMTCCRSTARRTARTKKRPFCAQAACWRS